MHAFVYVLAFCQCYIYATMLITFFSGGGRRCSMGTRVHKQGSEVRGPLFKLQFTGLMDLNKTLEFVGIFVSSHATWAKKEPPY